MATPARFPYSRCIAAGKTSMSLATTPRGGDGAGRITTHHDDCRHGTYVACRMTSRFIYQYHRALRAGAEELSA